MDRKKLKETDMLFDEKLRQSLKKHLETVQADVELKTKTKAFITAHIEADKTKPRKTAGLFFVKSGPGFSFQRAALAFSLVLVLIFSGVFYSRELTQVAAISVDINPSIELGLNTNDKVIDLKSFNEDGASLLERLQLKNLSLNEAMEKIFLYEASELGQGVEMSVTVAADGKDAERLLGEVQQMRLRYGKTSGGQPEFSASLASYADLDEAHQNGLSIGKYKVFREMKACGLDLSSHEVQDLSLSEMHELIGAQKRRQEKDGAGNHSAPNSESSHAMESGSTWGDDRGYSDGTGKQAGKH